MLALGLACALGLGLGSTSCEGHDRGRGAAAPKAARSKPYQRGTAAYYGGKFHGRKTASGERFDKNAMTAAHRKLPFGTIVRVTNLANGRSVEVRINDRGPFGRGIIDVSEAAAKKLGMIRRGVARVRLDVVKRPN